MAGFHEIIGHDDVVNHLQNAIQMGKVSHAYIFNGEVGAGKKMLASAFAMALQCEKHGTDPCMECDSCKRALSKNHPDIITITHEKPNSIGIEDIRIQLIDDQSELLQYMGSLVRSDPMQTVVVDVTALGIMEITRKKSAKTLAEQLLQLKKGE